MLQFINLRHSFGPVTVFEGFSWHIKNNQKIALVGPNGVGKTTLFHIATSKISPDKGDVVKSKDTTISLFHQIPNFDPKKTVLELAIDSNVHYQEYRQRREELDRKFETISHETKEFEELLNEQSRLEDFANLYDLHKLESLIKKVLSGLGFTSNSFDRKIQNFSPGFHHRLGLAIALLNPYNLLFLDEPTNHLDDAAKEWLAEYLRSLKTTFVLVSHDPVFLNQTTDTIVEVSQTGVLEFKGTLEEFLEEKNEIHEKQKSRFQKQETLLKKRMEWIERFRAKASKAKQVQSAIKKLNKQDKIESPEEIFWNKKVDYKFNFISDGKISFRLEEAAFRYQENERFIFQGVDMEVSSGDKIALVGPNGTGKSTLMRCVLGRHKLTGGEIYLGPKTEIGYFSQTHGEDLQKEMNILDTVWKKYPDMSEVDIRKILGFFSFSGESVYQKVETLSGGEQSRLRMALLVLKPCNLLLLDEPTNHLDMVTRESLKNALFHFPGSIVIISHDPDFLKDLCNRTFELSGGNIKNLNCSFNDYLEYHKEDVYSEPSFKEDKTQKIQQRISKNIEKNKIKKTQKILVEIEEKITKLEKEKKLYEEKLSRAESYTEGNYQSVLDDYNRVKQELNRLMEEWETSQLELEEMVS